MITVTLYFRGNNTFELVYVSLRCKKKTGLVSFLVSLLVSQCGLVTEIEK